jgi:hypothetical protein
MSSWLSARLALQQPEPEPELRAEPPADPASCFVVEFASEGKLGLHLLRATTQRLFTVEFLSEEGLAVNEPGIVPGCVLVAVQGEPLDGLTYDEGLERVRAAGRPLALTFEPASSDQASQTAGTAELPPPVEIIEQQEHGLRVMLDSDAEAALVGELAASLEAGPAGVDAVDEPEFWLRACLRSRKFDVAESALLLRSYMAWREERSIATLGGIYNERLRAQLASGFMQLTGGHDRLGRQIIHVLAGAHGESGGEFSMEETTRAVHFMVECCLRGSATAQARGVVFIIDMKGASETAITNCLRSLLPMLTAAALPLRVGRIYLINPPAFFKLVFPLASGLINQTMRKRLTFLRAEQLGELRRQIADVNLPAEYGGLLQSQHETWMENLEGCLAADSESLWPPLPVVPQLPAAPMPSTHAVARYDPPARGRWELFVRYDGDADGRLDRQQLHELLVRSVRVCVPLRGVVWCGVAWVHLQWIGVASSAHLLVVLTVVCFACLMTEQVKDVFGGEMDEQWFTEIWEEATAAAAAAAAASAASAASAGQEVTRTAGGQSEATLIDYRGFVRLFDESAAEEDEDSGPDEAAAGSQHPPPPIAAQSESEPELEPEPEPEPEPELQS